ncbi:MAG: Bor/Iss family lipoprotein [Gemmatimonadaceae bacterium]
MRVGRALTLAAVCLLTSACFHQVVQTGRTPGSTVVSKPWTATWVFGLVEAQTIDVTQQCPGGIATVATKMSFLNGLAAGVTFGIYSPRDVTVTCAAGRASLEQREIHVAKTATQAERVAAFSAAVELSERTSQPVVIRF